MRYSTQFVILYVCVLVLSDWMYVSVSLDVCVLVRLDECVWLCMFVRLLVCVVMCLSVWMYVSVRLDVCVLVRLDVCVGMSACPSACMCGYVSVRLDVCVGMCPSKCMS